MVCFCDCIGHCWMEVDEPFSVKQAKTLSEPLFPYCQSDPQVQIAAKMHPNTMILILKNWFENVLWKISAILSLPQYSKCNSRDPAARCWQRGSSSFHRKNDRLSAFAIWIAIFNHDSSLPMFATTVPTCGGHLRIVPVSVFHVETKNIVFVTYPMHNWVPYWLFTMVYSCVPHFNLWRGHKHPCSFQLPIALNLKSTRHYMGIDLVPYVKSRTSAQHNCKI